MYITDVHTKTKSGKICHTSTLLRESYREGDKVKSRTLLNLTHYPEKDVKAIKLALKNKNNLGVIKSLDKVTLKQEESVGAILLIKNIADEMGISKALSYRRNGKLALWQVIARVIDQGSRLSAMRLARQHNISFLNFKKKFDENSLYDNLKWLDENKDKIENKLFKMRFSDKKPTLFLYDVTSSYVEGEKNELAQYGYNRDKKKGKKQIVIGLLCEEKGKPISVEVFDGNTSDPSTLLSQIKKIKGRFGCERVTMVGDKGMIKSTGIENLKNHNLNYVTSITRRQIKTLIKEEIIQLELFEDKLCEVENGDNRYVLRLNPVRRDEVRKTRKSKLKKIKDKIKEQNVYLKEHERAKVDVAQKRVDKMIKKLKVKKWLEVKIKGRSLELVKNDKELNEISKLDGCYAIKTDLKKKDVTKETIHDRYKSLSKVEDAFRTCKKNHLEIRPLYVRKEESTRGHVLVVMLAYMIVQRLKELWVDVDMTVKEGIDELKQLCGVRIEGEEGGKYIKIPEPNKRQKELLDKASIRLPEVLASSPKHLVGKKKILNEHR